MILIFLFIIMVLLGIILIKSDIFDDADIAGGVMSTFGFIFLTASFLAIMVTYATANYKIQKNKIEYEGLCKRYDIITSEYEDVSKSDVISDITEWNIKVYNTKHWTESPWTNWFNPKEIADNLYYIPLEKEDKE